MNKYRPTALIIMDGWGVAPDGEGNAVTRANTPNWDRIIREYPVMTLHASGNEVGLSYGEMGNSEVGHLNIGAGRVYYQTLPRINKHIVDGSFFENKAFLQAAEHVKKNKSALHLMGLLSVGNVHASDEHCFALLKFAKEQKIKEVYLHLFLDGRDTAYNSGEYFISKLIEQMKKLKVGTIASLSGRYFAMDRDSRWDRIEKAYRAIADGVSDHYASDPIEAIQASYAANVFDEEFEPTVIGRPGKPTAVVQDGDAVIFFNYRPDRAREMAKAFVLPAFNKFTRTEHHNLFFVTMTEYEKAMPTVVAYPPATVHNSLAEVVATAGLKQFHIAETEKYAHITFFLNGTVEDPFPGEDRVIIPSPRVPSYATVPEMSSAGLVKETIKAIDSDKYDVFMINLANADMVGHTGDMAATVKACEAVDSAVGKITEYVLAKGGAVVITSDHGNAEEVYNLQTGEKDKEHSNNPVPLVIMANELKGQAGSAGDPPEGDLSLMTPVGVLADVAPTVLKLVGLELPPEMTGRSMI